MITVYAFNGRTYFFVFSGRLWFDVEKRYNTTDREAIMNNVLLWFDVEKRYNTTCYCSNAGNGSCGLM